jgi:hypothetical protein
MANATTIIPLSGSTQGKGIKVVQTSTLGNTIHATTTSATTVDRLYLWAVNSQAAATASTVLLTLEFGGVTSPDNLIQVPIPGQAGEVQLCDGHSVTGTHSWATARRR